MGFLRKLLGGSGGRGGDGDGLYFYVRADRTGEVIPLRLNRYNDLSLMDDQTRYYSRKIIVGQKSFDRIEAEFIFDKDRKFLTADVSGGELVDQGDYEAYLAQESSEG